MRNHVFALACALTCGVAFGSAPAAAQMVSGHVGFMPTHHMPTHHSAVQFSYQSPGFFPQPFVTPPVASSCCCPTVRRGFFSSFGCPTAAAYPQFAYPQYPAYQPYPTAMPYQPAYPDPMQYPAYQPAGYYPPAFAPGIGVGVGIGPVGVGIGTSVTHRRVHRQVCWRDSRGRRHCRWR